MIMNFRQVLEAQRSNNFDELVEALELFLFDTVNNVDMNTKKFRMEVIRKELVLNLCIRKAFTSICVKCKDNNNNILLDMIDEILETLEKDRACGIPSLSALYRYCKK